MSLWAAWPYRFIIMLEPVAQGRLLPGNPISKRPHGMAGTAVLRRGGNVRPGSSSRVKIDLIETIRFLRGTRLPSINLRSNSDATSLVTRESISPETDSWAHLPVDHSGGRAGDHSALVPTLERMPDFEIGGDVAG